MILLHSDSDLPIIAHLSFILRIYFMQNFNEFFIAQLKFSVHRFHFLRDKINWLRKAAQTSVFFLAWNENCICQCTQTSFMKTKEKINLMDKILRELNDVISSQTAVLKKIAQIEADNINLSDASLSDALSDIHEHVDAALVAATELQTRFTEVHDEFVRDNPIQEE
jgi:ElaB/YqjD/DUF883 family membrane-anchored ribosome-binding protein